MIIPVIQIKTEGNPNVYLRTDKAGWKQILDKYCLKKKLISFFFIDVEEEEYLRGRLKK